MTNLIKRVAGALAPRKDMRWDVPFVGLAAVPRIVIFTDRADATYCATFHYPLRHLQDKGSVDFAVMSSAGVRSSLSRTAVRGFARDLVASAAPRAVIFSRYATPFGVELLDAFRLHDVPVFYYCDDDLLNLPQALGEGVLATHGSSQVLHARRACLGAADGILVSTPHLGTVLNAQFPAQRIEVLLYPPYLGSLVKRASRPSGSAGDRAVTIGYMGSKGHQRDLQIAVPALEDLMERLPAIRFETFGTIAMPDALHRFGGRVAAHGPRGSYGEFLQTLYDLRWDVGLAPLADNAFNRCRSPIKILEYTACDIPTVASDMSVYRPVLESGGGLLAADHAWGAALERAVTDPQLRGACLDRVRETCAGRFGLSDVAAGIMSALHLNQPNGGRLQCSGIS